MNEAEKEWWDNWWAADYSWEGLAAIPTIGWDNLQAYWAAQKIGGDALEDYLIEEKDVEGNVIRRWTPFHLPYHFADGTPTEKFTDLEGYARRLQEELSPIIEAWLTGQDHAHLVGIVTPSFPALPRDEVASVPCFLNLHQAHLSQGALNFSECSFPGAVNFNQAQFSGKYTDFRAARFSGGVVSFEEAHFSGGDADFRWAQFTGGWANFESVQFIGGWADFEGAQFAGGWADFERAHFTGGYADFGSAQFSGGWASFDDARFTGGWADFGRAKFTGGAVYFVNAHFTGGWADFWGVTFQQNAFFNSAKFKGQIDFVGSEFEKRSIFTDLTWPENPLDAEGAFTDTVFNRQADFTGKDFTAFAAFRGAIFNREVVLSRDTIFEKEHVSRALRLTEGNIKTALRDRARKLAEKTFQEEERAAAQRLRLQLQRVRVGLPETGEKAYSINAMDDTVRKAFRLQGDHRVLYRELSKHAADETKKLALYSGDKPIFELMEYEKKAAIEAMAKENYQKLINSGELIKRRENHYREFELGARALRVGLENARDNLGQMRMLRVELLAQRKHPAMDFGEKWLSHAYDFLSDFGISFFRPAVALLASWLLMGLVYTGWYTAENQTRFQDVALEGLNFSAQAVFKPLSYWGYDEIEEDSFGQSLIYGTGAFNCAEDDAACRENAAMQTKSTNWRSFLVRLVATVQSFFSIVMLFLAALAARRLFQMRS